MKEYEEGYIVEYINKFIENLPEHKRKIFILRYWYSESINDISSRTLFSTGKIKSILHRTRKELKQFLQKEGIVI